jgi:hypothetical protein
MHEEVDKDYNDIRERSRRGSCRSWWRRECVGGADDGAVRHRAAAQ